MRHKNPKMDCPDAAKGVTLVSLPQVIPSFEQALTHGHADGYHDHRPDEALGNEEGLCSLQESHNADSHGRSSYVNS
jgi:hypothetical protein